MISGKLPITTIRFADDIFSEIDFFKFSRSIVVSLCLAINSADLEIFILRKLRNDSGFSLFSLLFVKIRSPKNNYDQDLKKRGDSRNSLALLGVTPL